MENTKSVEENSQETFDISQMLQEVTNSVNKEQSNKEQSNVKEKEEETEVPSKAETPINEPQEVETEEEPQEEEAQEELLEEVKEEVQSKEEDDLKLTPTERKILEKGMSSEARQWAEARVRRLQKATKLNADLERQVQEAKALAEKAPAQEAVKTWHNHPNGYVLNEEFLQTIDQEGKTKQAISLIEEQLAKAYEGQNVNFVAYDANGNPILDSRAFQGNGASITALNSQLFQEQSRLAQIRQKQSAIQQQHSSSVSNYKARVGNLVGTILGGWGKVLETDPAAKDLHGKVIQHIKANGFDTEDPWIQASMQMYVMLNRLSSQVNEAIEADKKNKTAKEIQKTVGPVGKAHISGGKSKPGKPNMVHFNPKDFIEE